MAVKKVLTYGTPSLRESSKEVHKISKKIKELIADLTDTMYATNAVGLAAPQIGVNYRVFVIDTSRSDEPLNPIVFINPKIVKKSGGFAAKEGCISFPEVYTEVRRYKKLVVKALDKNGKPFVVEADGGLLASVLQHENDHLDGVLFIDHCQNRFDVDDQLQKYKLPPIEEDRLFNGNDWQSD
jgi:peptide deformylase